MEWERLYHDSACYFSAVAQTDDGGYILGGPIYEWLADDVVSESDVVLAKIDGQGEVQWQKIYGGTGYEEIGSVRQTRDGGYLFVGSSDSSPSVNKEAPKFGLGDAWVVKVDGEGNKQWERSFGGTGGDSAASFWQTTDGGFVLAGYSASRPSGNKEAELYGIADGWVVKIDAQGNKQWDRSFGGQSVQGFSSLRQLADHGYVVAGWSSSPPSGNKEAPHFGGGDGWLIRLDPEGKKQWEQSFGGTKGDRFVSFDQAADGGFILGGESSSPPSGNKESLHLGGTNYWIADYWIVKVDAAGNKQWDESYGARTNSQELTVVRQADDGGYLLAGTPKLIKVDAQGNPQWENFLSSTKLAASGSLYRLGISDMQLTKDGGYILCGSAYDPAAGIPVSGCGESSWVAKFENVVSRSGEVVAWTARAGVVLESVDDLNGEWKTDQSDVLSLGAANAIAFVPTGQERYYRLRETIPSNEAPRLGLGALLTWPVSANQTLEIASSKNGPWTAFSGDQGTNGTKRCAIVPQNLKQHYFRARTTD